MTANQNKHTLWTAAKAIRLSLILALISLAGWPLTILAAHLSDVPVGDVCNLVFFSPEVFVDGFAPGKLYTLITFPFFNAAFVYSAKGFIFFLLLGLLVERRIPRINLAVLVIIALYMGPLFSMVHSLAQGDPHLVRTGQICGINYAVSSYVGAFLAFWFYEGRNWSKLLHVIGAYLLLTHVIHLIYSLVQGLPPNLLGYYVAVPFSVIYVILLLRKNKTYTPPKLRPEDIGLTKLKLIALVVSGAIFLFLLPWCIMYLHRVL